MTSSKYQSVLIRLLPATVAATLAVAFIACGGDDDDGASTGDDTGSSTGSSTGTSTGDATGSSTGTSTGDATGSSTGTSTGDATGTATGSTSLPPSMGDGAWERDFKDKAAGVNVDDAGGNDCTVEASALDGLPSVTKGDATIYAGFVQRGVNQDPVVARVDGGTVSWCKTHETQGPDGRAWGLTWDGGESLYVVYSIVGGGTDLEMKDGWFRSFGGHAGIPGGNKNVSVLGLVDAQTGDLVNATHIIAVLSSGKVNSHAPREAPLVTADGKVEFLGGSAHKPLGVDRKTSMTCTDYPFDTRYRFEPDLKSLVCAESTNCSDNMTPCE